MSLYRIDANRWRSSIETYRDNIVYRIGAYKIQNISLCTNVGVHSIGILSANQTDRPLSLRLMSSLPILGRS